MTTSELELIHARALHLPVGARQALAREANAGRLERVARGVYVPRGSWVALNAREQHLTRMRAIDASRSGRTVFSHWSAAAAHGLPIAGQWPDLVHVRVRPGEGALTSGGIVRRAMPLDDDEVVERGGLLVTSVARTVIDLVASTGFAEAVVIADASVHVDRFGQVPALTSIRDLREHLQRRMRFRGHARARTAIEFATTKAGSPLESGSRANMWLGGFPRPQLQTEFRDHRGFIGEVDFHWPDHSVIGEADGESKYLDERLRGGLNIEQVLVAEKWREDRLRALGWRVVRWGWKTANDPTALAAVLEAVGLPRSRRRPPPAEW